MLNNFCKEQIAVGHARGPAFDLEEIMFHLDCFVMMYCESGNALWLCRHLLFEMHTVVCGELCQSVVFVVEVVRRAE